MILKWDLGCARAEEVITDQGGPGFEAELNWAAVRLEPLGCLLAFLANNGR